VLSPEERKRERERLVGEGNEMLLAVGVLETRKNLINALRALQHLPRRYRLVLAGGDGYGSEAIHAQALLEPRAKLLGYVSRERLGILYQAASALLFPSLEEGFGLPVLEAMSYGLPVLASRTSSLPEVGGDAVLYVDPHDPLDIAGKAAQAVESADCRERLVRMGFERALQFPWRRTAEATLKVYEELL
jgi:glycosyltransferase involved in cell wall biosynthesis